MDYNKYYTRLQKSKGGNIFSHYNDRSYIQKTQDGFIYAMVCASEKSKAYGKEFEGLVVELYIDDEVSHDIYFNHLKYYKDDIEQELDICEIVWQSSEDTFKGTVCRIFAKKSVEIDEENRWDEYIKWQIDTMIKFMKILPKYTNKVK